MSSGNCHFEIDSQQRSYSTQDSHGMQTVILTSAESILTLKNRESIHFDFLLRGFVEKESIHDSWIDSWIDSLLYNDSLR